MPTGKYLLQSCRKTRQVNGVEVIVFVVLMWETILSFETMTVFFWFEITTKSSYTFATFVSTFVQGAPFAFLFWTVIVVQDYMMRLYHAMTNAP